MEMEDFEAKLINAVKKFPFLYDVTHRRYKDHYTRVMAWERIAVILHVSVARAKSRWRSLRNTYRIELGRIAINQPGKWRYFDMMTFVSGNKLYKSEISDFEPTANTNTAPSIKSEVFDEEADMEDLTPDCEIPEVVISETESNCSVKMDPSLSQMPPPLPVTLSYGNFGTELKIFMEAMTQKIASENLDRDQMDELQEQMLVLLNRKLREFRQVKSNTF